MVKKPWVFLCVMILLGLVTSCDCDGGSEGPVVHAILFYSPSCPHCHQVMTEVLPPLEKKYGDQLQVLELDTATPEGQQVYQSAVAYFSIPQERRGVPTLVLDSIVLVGSGEIPQYLPSLIERGLKQEGGVDWPAIPGFIPPAD
ncbi:MAG: thioredoxin family protein [Anaerolineae bacterium]|nr:thioredoxin family protein [Anaerolineae bacterium]